MTEKKRFSKSGKLLAPETPSGAGTKRILPTRRQVLTGVGAVAAAGAFRINPIGRAKAQGSGTCTIYASMPSEFLDQMAQRFNSLGTGVTLQTFYAPTNKAYERVLAELSANRVNADLLLLADPSPFLDLKGRDALLPYESEVYSHYPEGHFDPDHTWVNGRSLATMLSVRSGTENVPQTWEGLADSTWQGRLGMLDVRVGGTGYNWYFTLRQVYGKEIWQELAALNPTLQRGHGQLMDQLVTSQIDISEQLGYYVRSFIVDRGAEVDAVYPTDVVPVTMAPLGIMKQAPNPEAAKVVFDWWLSKEGQQALQEINGCYSVRDDVPAIDNKPAYGSLKTIEYDLEEYAARREEYTRDFIEAFDL